MNFSPKVILKKLEWIRNGRKWKAGKEIMDAIKADLRKQEKKQKP